MDDNFRDELQAAKSEQEIMKLFGAEEQQAVEDTLEEVEQPLEMARDISRHAYPIVLGVGVLICAFLFLLL